MRARTLVALAGCFAMGCGSGPAIEPEAGPGSPAARSGPGVEVPFGEDCATDDDCVVTCDRWNECCGDLCAPCDNVMNRLQHQQLGAWRSAECPEHPDCPVADCDVPLWEPKAVCREGACALEKVGIRQ